jgi:hypothetical protein
MGKRSAARVSAFNGAIFAGRAIRAELELMEVLSEVPSGALRWLVRQDSTAELLVRPGAATKSLVTSYGVGCMTRLMSSTSLGPY